MGMVVRTNIQAVNANRQLGINNSGVGKSLEKLASGFKINRAGDDASGLAISEKMKAQIKGLETASANSQDGISLIQTAEGALAEVHDMLNRMVELAGKSANGTMDDEVDRAALNKEMIALKDEIDRIAESTNFNGLKLLDGSLDNVMRVANSVDLPINSDFSGGIADVGSKTVLSQAGKDAVATSFVIDFGNYSIDNLETDDTITVTLTGAGGDTQAIVLKHGDGTTDLSSTAAIAKSFVDAFALETNVFGGTDFVPGDFTLTANGSKVTLVQNVAPDDADKVLDADMTVALAYADADGASLAGAVNGTWNVGTTDNIQGGLKTESRLASTTVNISDLVSKIKDGSSVTIGDQTYTFALGKDSTIDKSGALVVDLTHLEEADLVAGNYDDIGARLTDAAAGNGMFTVGYKDATDQITLHEIKGQKKADLSKADSFQAQVKFNEVADATGKGLTMQIGDTADAYNKITVAVRDMSCKGLGIGEISVANQESASDALALLKNVDGANEYGAINIVSSVRADMGAMQNRLEHTINNLDVAAENLTSANSRIRDTDMAKEMMNYTKLNVLTQAAQAMLAQANSSTQSVLQLLQ